MMKQPKYVEAVLVLGIEHMPSAHPDFGGIRADKLKYGGYLLYLDLLGSSSKQMPKWLVPILQLAQEWHCTMINFNADAYTLDTLPTWEWSGHD